VRAEREPHLLIIQEKYKQEAGRERENSRFLEAAATNNRQKQEIQTASGRLRG
jgi:hypothetical protein